MGKLRDFVEAIRDPEHPGDVAALKLSLLFGKESQGPFTENVKVLKEMSFRPIDLEYLQSLDPSTFGFQFWKFLNDHGLQPLNFSEKGKALFDDYPIGIRYVRVHDMIHVLTGFDPDIAGEIGVYAFIQRQNYSPALNFSAKVARVVGHILFWNRSRHLAAADRGQSLATMSLPLITFPFEQNFHRPLEELRNELGLVGI